MNEENTLSSTGTVGEAPRELVVIAKHEIGLRVTREGIASAAGADVSSLVRLS